MKNSVYLILSCIITGLSGCSDFEEVNTNPDSTTKVTSAMIATNLLYDIITTDNGGGKNMMRDEFLGKYISWTEPQDIDLAFNFVGNASYGTLANIRNVPKMIENAPTEGTKTSYTALGHFIRVYKFFNVTMRVGDIPYSEAIKGEEEIYFPKYDTQKEVFLGMLNELDEADKLFASGESFEGDIIYGGNVSKWRKAVNVLQLKLLINLYTKEGDSDLRLRERFQNVLSRPLFESNSDNLQIVYSSKAGQKYPYSMGNNNQFSNNDRLTTIIVDILKQYKDYRLFYYGRPTSKSIEDGLEADNWDSYNGVNPTLTEEEIIAEDTKGIISQINDRYEDLEDCEPHFFLSYSEMNLILAEAVARGFISGSAKDYYDKGVRASMEFVASYTPNDAKYHHNRIINDEYITGYLSSREARYPDNLNEQIDRIITQKYIAHFLQVPYNGFFEYRRTGIPYIPINPASNRNIPSDKMPLRWMYPTDEKSYNSDNLNEAIQRQYNGTDSYIGVMWILQ